MSVRYHSSADAGRRLSWVLLLSIGVAMTVSLYYVKTRAQAAKNDVTDLRRTIVHEQAAIKVLEAELAYLQSPERLQVLSQDVLGLEGIKPNQHISINNLTGIHEVKEGDVNP